MNQDPTDHVLCRQPVRPRRRSPSLRTWCGLLAASLFVTLGCGGPTADYSALGLVNVSGTVTMDGSPLEGVTVLFEATDGQFSSGITDAGGRYTLRIDSAHTGVTPGEKTVRVTSRPLSEEWGEEVEKPAAKVAGGQSSEQIPVRYNRESELWMVVPSENYDIALSGAKSE